MKRNNWLLATVSAVVISAAAPAIAADNMKAGETKSMVKEETMNYGNVVRPLFGASIKADDLIGTRVDNLRGEDLGEVESVIVDRSGQVKAVVVGVGGFLGMGEHDVAVDWQDLYITDDGKTVQVDMTEAELKKLPKYEYSDDAYRGKSFSDNTYRDMRRDDRAFDYTAPRPRDLRESADAKDLLDAKGNLKASELIGMEVVDSAQKTVGEIDDILLDKSGKPMAAIGTGGVVGIGERVVLVGWDKLDIHKVKDQVQIRTVLSEADLKKLPEHVRN